MPNNNKKTKKIMRPIKIIGPRISNTQAFGTYASNKGGGRLTRKSRARK
jgi:hypothetical protein